MNHPEGSSPMNSFPKSTQVLSLGNALGVKLLSFIKAGTPNKDLESADANPRQSALAHLKEVLLSAIFFHSLACIYLFICSRKA